jgi:hypothetical protein
MENSKFYNELKVSLSHSTADERNAWASTLIKNKIDLKEMSNLLMCDKKIASRFSWMLSDIGTLEPSTLLTELPFLFKLSDEITHINFKISFATYWKLCGIPVENESEAINLLFGWLQSGNINVTTKSRALFALYNLTKKYPELKNELKICLEDQLDKNTKDFNKRAQKVINKLNQ